MVWKVSTQPRPGSLTGQADSRGKTTPRESKFIFTREIFGLSLSIFAPILTMLLEHLFWPVVRPFTWFFFYPAIIFSSWIGGVTGGILASLLSTLLAWWSFVPPEHLFWKSEVRYLVSAGFFLGVSLVITFFHGSVRRKTQQIASALNEAREAGNELQAAHDGITRLFEQASDGIFIVDLSGHILKLNAAACRMLGYPEEQSDEIVGQSLDAFLASANIKGFWQAKERSRTREVQIEEWSLRRADRTEFPVEISAKAFPDDRWQIFSRDISERKFTERKLNQINRANRALSRCNQVLVRANDERALLVQVCDIVVRDAGYPFCWVGQAMNNEAKTVEVIAESGLDSDYTSSLGVTWRDDASGRGPTGTCIRSRKTVVTRDIASSSEMAPWRERALMHGYASSLAIPLFLGAEVFGALSIYASEADAFSADEVNLLTELAKDLAFGISTLRTRAERTRAEEELRTLNAELEERVLVRTRELQKAHEQEFEIGCKIQQTLLLDPLPEYMAGICIAALALPTQRIDGDFVVFTKPRGRAFDVIVGDVMGKGIPAALLGAATKSHLLKALGQLSASSRADELPRPEDVVMRMHADISRQLVNLESFVTLSYTRIDPLRRIAQLVDCGHTGMIQLHGKSGTADLRHGDNLPLGVREDEIYKQRTFSLEAGDSVFLFSDGITEARNASGEIFGLDRLREFIEEHKELEPAALVEAIRGAVVSYCGSDHLADDVTMVAVRVDETGPPIQKAVKTIKSDLRQLHEAREFVRSFCEHLPDGLLSCTSVDALELAVNEAASNIMKHAYHGRTDRLIHIEAEAFPSRATIQLHHDGSPFSPKPVSQLPGGTLRESGWGLFMLSRCVDEVHYFLDERGGSCICLTRHTDPKRKMKR